MNLSLLAKLSLADKPQITEIPASELEFERKIGSGGFGMVYKGTWNKAPVAIKVFKLEGSIRPRRAAIQAEAETWAKLLHPQILQFLGANISGEIPYIVMPYLENGNARGFIKQHPECNRNKILHQVTLGLVYLHSRNVVHGDIKGFNVLIDGARNAVLCDFGIAQIRDDTISTTMGSGQSSIAGTPSYMSPERLQGGSLRKPCDIYSFGMLIYEVHTNASPLILHVAYSEFVQMVATDGHRPQKPDRSDAPQLTDEIWHLAKRCWAGTATTRPSINEVCDSITPLLSFSLIPTQSSFSLTPLPSRHRLTVSSIAFSSDGTRIVSSSEDKTVCIWDLNTGQLATGPIKGHSFVQSVAFSPDSRHIVFGNISFPYIQMRDASNGTLLSLPFKGHTGIVEAIAFSPDGQQIASGSWDNTIRIWDAMRGITMVGPIEGHTSIIRSVAFSPDGLYIASGSDDYAVCVWSTKTGKLEPGLKFRGHLGSVYSVAFSPRGRWVVSGSRDNDVRVWDTASGTSSSSSQCFKDHAGCVTSVAFGLDGKHVVSGSTDGTVRIWNFDSGEQVSVLRLTQGEVSLEHKIWSMAVSLAGDRIVAGTESGSIYMWKRD